MSKNPRISAFLDDEERELHELLESGQSSHSGDALSAERIAQLKQFARNTINEERVKISLRLPKSDLDRLKARALREGLPYQTLINSILHKAASA